MQEICRKDLYCVQYPVIKDIIGVSRATSIMAHEIATRFISKLGKPMGNDFITLSCSGTSGVLFAASLQQHIFKQTKYCPHIIQVGKENESTHRLLVETEFSCTKPNPKGLNFFVDDFIETGSTLLHVANVIEGAGLPPVNAIAVTGKVRELITFKCDIKVAICHRVV